MKNIKYLTHEVDPDELILLGDLDEIPDLTTYQCDSEGLFLQKHYCYYCNVVSPKIWKGTVIQRRKNINSITKIRDRRRKIRPFIGGGWHFSFTGNLENMIYKVQSFSHLDLNTPEFINKISEYKNKFIDPCRYFWGKRNDIYLSVEMPSGPKYLLDNINKYKYLFYNEKDNV